MTNISYMESDNMENRVLFGHLENGVPIYQHELKNEKATAHILTLGGILQSFTVFGTDIVAGFGTLEGYLSDDSHQCELIGRTCNRIANAQFEMDGEVFPLYANDGQNHLHGGREGYGRRVWDVLYANDDTIALALFSPDGEEGYPGDVRVKVTYTLRDTALSITYEATTTKKTPFAMTNHAYFNLYGYGEQDILHHTLWLDADKYTEVDPYLIPTGQRPNVEGTHYDFRTPREIGAWVDADFEGYDTNFIVAGRYKKEICGMTLPHVATLSANHMALSVYSDQLGVQVYIGNMLQGKTPMKGGKPQRKHHTVCLETQPEPNSVKYGKTFLCPGETYQSTTIYEVQLI